MMIRMTELVKRDIIDITTGAKIGRLCDFTVDSTTATVKNLIVFGRRRCFGFLRSEDDIIIDWCDVKMFGKDTILINRCPEIAARLKKNIIRELFELFK
jgi:YlmC/YmxH family sporulation protein